MTADFLQLSGTKHLVFGVANRKSVAYFIGQTLQAAGAEVIYVVRSDARRESVAKILGTAEVHVCDVEYPEQIERLREALSARGHVFHGLVHSIAFADYDGSLKPFHETGKQQFL